MRKFILATGCMLAAALVCFVQSADAQECSSCQGAGAGTGSVIDGGGIVESVPCRGRGCGNGHLRGAVSGVSNLIQGPQLGQSGAIVDADGRVQPQAEWIHPKQTLVNAAQDHFSPNPIYAYSTPGLRAGHVHAWNQERADVYSWHGGYNSWRFGQPTALVVPPTASYQSSYAWGVGQTRSTPIHHQFGRGAGSTGGVGAGSQNTPYFPYSTNQFGYYPVRASW